MGGDPRGAGLRRVGEEDPVTAAFTIGYGGRKPDEFAQLLA